MARNVKPRNQHRRNFQKFHKENPIVYTYFAKFAREDARKGVRRISSDGIIHRVRNALVLASNGRPVVGINNNHTAFYARMFCAEHPEYAGKFNFRRIGP